jgi:hypothetical protein
MQNTQGGPRDRPFGWAAGLGNIEPLQALICEISSNKHAMARLMLDAVPLYTLSV